MSENEKTTYVAYLRQSTKKQEISGLGIEAQREIIGRYLGQEKPIAEFVETESGKKTDRPKLTEALALCRKTGSTLIVAKLDRLSRNVAFTSKLLESDVEIKFCDFPEANRLVLHIIASIAEYEAGLISQRTKWKALYDTFHDRQYRQSKRKWPESHSLLFHHINIVVRPIAINKF